MSFIVTTDTSANLPTPYVLEHSIPVVPFHYYINDEEFTCPDTETFDGDSYYAAIKAGTVVKTSQVTIQQFKDFFRPYLQQGLDVLHISMSSGISGAYNSSVQAAEELKEEFPQRKLVTVDSLAACMGEGLIVRRASEYREKGASFEETEQAVRAFIPRLYQHVMLEDLFYLSRGGRVSGTKAIIGSVLGIRPLLKGSEQGELVVVGKARGRKQGIKAIVDKYLEVVENPAESVISVCYTDIKDVAEEIAEQFRKAAQPKEILIYQYEPVTGSYLGPGAVAMFYEGRDDARTH